jgi:hypothetical protein
MTNEAASLSWIRDAEEALKLAMNVSDAQTQKTNLESVASSLHELVGAFRSMAEATGVVRPLGWEGRSPIPEVRKSLRQASETLDNRHINTALMGLQKFRGEAHAELISFWRQHAAGRLGNVAELQVLANTLREVSGLAELSQRLEAVLGDLAKTQEQLPSVRSADLLDNVETALQQLEESLQPESVRRFFSLVTRGGASIELLTDDVIGWLNVHNAIQGFKIVAGSAPELVDD